MKLIFLNLIFLFNINYSLSDACSEVKPRINTDCHTKTDSKNLCCLVTNDAGNANVCQSQTRNIISTTNSTFKTNNINYSLDCGVGAFIKNSNLGGSFPVSYYYPNYNKLVLPIQQCGSVNPIKRDDCSSFSAIGNSCCFYTKSKDTGCYYLGTKYAGNATYAGINIDCIGNYLGKYNYFFFIFVLAFL